MSTFAADHPPSAAKHASTVHPPTQPKSAMLEGKIGGRARGREGQVSNSGLRRHATEFRITCPRRNLGAIRL